LTDLTPSPEPADTWPPLSPVTERNGRPVWRYGVTHAVFGGPLAPPAYASPDAEAIGVSAVAEWTAVILWRWI
jgi:hypothetical protein